MNRWFYLRLSINHLKKNARMIVPYILTSVLTTMMLYLVVSLTNNPHINELEDGRILTQMLGYGVVIISVFALIFLFYTHSFLVKRRQKEFALFSILGMEKKHLARVLFYETCICLLASLGFGIGFGLLFDKAMVLLIERILGIKVTLGFYFSIKALKVCLVTFSLIYLLIYIYSMVRMHISSPIELLHAEHMGEKEPKARWFLSFVGLFCLGIGYYLSVTTKNPLSAFLLFFVAVLLVIIGTYILFTTISIAVLKLLKKNKHYYYKTNHFISVSSMMYRMKQNAVGLANICILSTMVLVMLSTTLCMWFSMGEVVKTQWPREVVAIAYKENWNRSFNDLTEKLIQNDVQPQHVLAYHGLTFSGYLQDGVLATNFQQEGMNAISKAESFICVPYDEIKKTENFHQTLKPNEIYVYSKQVSLENQSLSLFGKDYTIKKQLSHLKLDESHSNPMADVVDTIYIIVNNADTLQKMEQDEMHTYGKNASRLQALYAFDCDGKDASVVQKMKKTKDPLFQSFLWESRSEKAKGLIGMYGGFLFIGIFLSILFIMATILIMYYKQITEGYEDKERFEIMQKVGLEHKDVKKAIHSQVLTVFFMPLLVAGMHVAFAYPLIEKLLHLMFVSDSLLYIKVIVACFAVFALIYALIYFLTSKVYYGIVRRSV